MLGIFSSSTNPAFNLATEEYLLKKREEDIFFLYINQPSVIVGKHQNTLAEIDHDYTLKNNIPVYRRLSGGGTVYHDLGNLNFCFITNEERGNLVDFEKHTLPVVKALENLGLTVTVGKRHDLYIIGKKITGTASHVFRNRAMHHGTLLYSADLTILNKCLNASHKKYRGKAVKSVRSSVTNISEHLSGPVTMEKFSDHIYSFLLSYFPEVRKCEMSVEDNNYISDIVKEKYSTWEWNYGYSPVYEIERTINAGDARISSKVIVEKGIITKASFHSTISEDQHSLQRLSAGLIGLQHDQKIITKVISTLSILLEEQILKLLF